jgi:CTP:molybdopterin cytidylyltransferase MocA
MQLIINRGDGKISLAFITDDAHAAETHRKWQETARPEWLPSTYRVVEEPAPITEPRAFRDAWRDDGIKIKTDMPVAKGIHMFRIRQARNEKLASTDADFVRMLDTDDAGLLALKTRRQKLRDLPVSAQAAVNDIDTPQDLIDYWPDDLWDVDTRP